MTADELKKIVNVIKLKIESSDSKAKNLDAKLDKTLIDLQEIKNELNLDKSKKDKVSN